MTIEKSEDLFATYIDLNDMLKKMLETKENAIRKFIDLMGGEVTREELEKRGLNTEIMMRAIFVNLQELYWSQMKVIDCTNSVLSVTRNHHSLLMTISRVLKDIAPILKDVTDPKKASRVESLEKNVSEMKEALGTLNITIEKLPNSEDIRDMRSDMENLRDRGMKKLQELADLVKALDIKRDDQHDN